MDAEMKSQNRCLSRTNYDCTTSPKNLPVLMTAETVLKALAREEGLLGTGQ